MTALEWLPGGILSLALWTLVYVRRAKPGCRMTVRWALLAVILVQQIGLYTDRWMMRRAREQMTALLNADANLKRADDRLQQEAAKVLRSCTGSKGLL